MEELYNTMSVYLIGLRIPSVGAPVETSSTLRLMLA